MFLSLKNIATLFLLTAVLTIGLALAPSAPSYVPTEGKSSIGASISSSVAQVASVSSAEAQSFTKYPDYPGECYADRVGDIYVDEDGDWWRCELAHYTYPYYAPFYSWIEI